MYNDSAVLDDQIVEEEIQSSKHTDSIRLKELHNNLLTDIKQQKQSILQHSKAMILLSKINTHGDLFLHHYLETIESKILAYKNHECFYDVITKERDNENHFINMIKLTRNNIHHIFFNYDLWNLRRIEKLYENDYIHIKPQIVIKKKKKKEDSIK